jgi:CBS domain containing-hemolysin-like protein
VPGKAVKRFLPIERVKLKSNLSKYLAAWLVMLAVSVANGAARDFTYGRRLGELAAHQLSTASGILLLGAVIWGFGKLGPPSYGREAAAIGLLWAALTAAFLQRHSEPFIVSALAYGGFKGENREGRRENALPGRAGVPVQPRAAVKCSLTLSQLITLKKAAIYSGRRFW